MQLLAHRGLTEYYPPNSLSAFVAALNSGYGIEVDIRATTDGRFVVAHDPQITRVDSETLHVGEYSLDQLRTAVGGTAGREPKDVLPTLTDVFTAYEGHGPVAASIALHLKDFKIEGIEEQLVATLEKANQCYTGLNIYNNVFIFDIPISTAKKFESIAPELSVAVSVGDSEYFPSDEHPTVYRYEDIQHLSCYDTIWADEWQSGHYTKEFFLKCHQSNHKIYAVSPELHLNTSPKHPACETPQNVWPRLNHEHVIGICTDLPFELDEYMRA